MSNWAPLETLPIDKIRADFPILQAPLVYLDSAATSQKPLAVIEAESQYYLKSNANVHRGIYALSQEATGLYEAARQTTRHFLNAKHNHEIIFTRGTTESINLIAYSYGHFINAGDEILISAMEHHSNIVPWQVLCAQKQAKLVVIPILEDGTLDLISYQNSLNERTKLVSITHVSNALGTINPVKLMIDFAHELNIPVLIDGAQAVPHLEVDVQALDCDFYVFSAHKLYGPTGVGVLYAKENWLEKMPPYQTGGDMILQVSFEKTDYNVLPYKFEAGTPNIAGVVGLGAAITYLQQFPMSLIMEQEAALLRYATGQLESLPGLKIIGTSEHKCAVISFVMEAAHPHDISTILDDSGIAIRAGHHCAMPLMHCLNVSATARMSLGIYSNQEDVDRLIIGLHRVIELFS